MTTTLFLIRHGDRYDYQDKQGWKRRCDGSTALTPSDPPLSALGHEQARELAAHLADEGIEAILTSPYLRALQTAQPLARATGLPLLVEWALAESHQRPGALPTVDERLPYFPEIDEGYQPLMQWVATYQEGDELPDGEKLGVEPRVEHLRRMLFLAGALQSPAFAGKRVALVTHAASIALVAALMNAASLDDPGKLAPCSALTLTIAPDGKATVLKSGHDTAHLTGAAGPMAASRRVAGNTGAWGFSDSADQDYDLQWVQARREGPPKTLPVQPPRPAPGSILARDEYNPESVVKKAKVDGRNEHDNGKVVG